MRSTPSTTRLVSLCRRTGRTVATIALSVTLTGAAVAGWSSGTAGAHHRAALPTNALAAEVVSSSSSAVDALDWYEATGSPEAMLEYLRERTEAARFAARELGYDEFEMIRAWRSSTLAHQRAVLTALTQVGVPYRSLAKAPGEGFDCSGLTSFAWSEAGVELPRSSGDQIRAATRTSLEDAQAGDLVHYPGHVMLYLGVEDAIVHAVTHGRTVEIDTIAQSRAGRVAVGAVSTATSVDD